MAPETCNEHKTLTEKVTDMHADVKAILDRLSKGDVTFATTVLRLDNMEKVVYGALGLALTGLAVSIIQMTLKGH